MADPRHRDQWLVRFGLAIGGGYLVASGGAACLALVMNGLGIARAQAAMSATMAGFILYLVAALYAFADRTAATLAAHILGGGAILAVAALLIRTIHASQ